MSGTPRKESFANTIRTAINELVANGREVSTTNISIQARLMNNKDHKRMLNALCDMTNVGKLVRLRAGVYGLTTESHPETKSQVMWRLLRMRRRITVEDLVEMASVSEGYAGEWLRTLAKRQVVKAEGDAFRLLKDTVEMPGLTDNAAKLRALREKKKQAAANALDAANKALSKAMQAISDL